MKRILYAASKRNMGFIRSIFFQELLVALLLVQLATCEEQPGAWQKAMEMAKGGAQVVSDLWSRYVWGKKPAPKQEFVYDEEEEDRHKLSKDEDEERPKLLDSVDESSTKDSLQPSEKVETQNPQFVQQDLTLGKPENQLDKQSTIPQNQLDKQNDPISETQTLRDPDQLENTQADRVEKVDDKYDDDLQYEQFEGGKDDAANTQYDYQGNPSETLQFQQQNNPVEPQYQSDQQISQFAQPNDYSQGPVEDLSSGFQDSYYKLTPGENLQSMNFISQPESSNLQPQTTNFNSQPESSNLQPQFTNSNSQPATSNLQPQFTNFNSQPESSNLQPQFMNFNSQPASSLGGFQSWRASLYQANSPGQPQYQDMQPGSPIRSLFSKLPSSNGYLNSQQLSANFAPQPQQSTTPTFDYSTQNFEYSPFTPRKPTSTYDSPTQNFEYSPFTPRKSTSYQELYSSSNKPEDNGFGSFSYDYKPFSQSRYSSGSGSSYNDYLKKLLNSPEDSI